jgi:hypothetical protein
VAPGGDEIAQAQWEDPGFRAFGMLLGGKQPALLIFNPTDQALEWRVPAAVEGRQWVRRLDSASGSVNGSEPASNPIDVPATSVVLLTTTD